jgi:hypothetical protein
MSFVKLFLVLSFSFQTLNGIRCTDSSDLEDLKQWSQNYCEVTIERKAKDKYNCICYQKDDYGYVRPGYQQETCSFLFDESKDCVYYIADYLNVPSYFGETESKKGCWSRVQQSLKHHIYDTEQHFSLCDEDWQTCKLYFGVRFVTYPEICEDCYLSQIKFLYNIRDNLSYGVQQCDKSTMLSVGLDCNEVCTQPLIGTIYLDSRNIYRDVKRHIKYFDTPNIKRAYMMTEKYAELARIEADKQRFINQLVKERIIAAMKGSGDISEAEKQELLETISFTIIPNKELPAFLQKEELTQSAFNTPMSFATAKVKSIYQDISKNKMKKKETVLPEGGLILLTPQENTVSNKKRKIEPTEIAITAKFGYFDIDIFNSLSRGAQLFLQSQNKKLKKNGEEQAFIFKEENNKYTLIPKKLHF